MRFTARRCTRMHHWCFLDSRVRLSNRVGLQINRANSAKRRRALAASTEIRNFVLSEKDKGTGILPYEMNGHVCLFTKEHSHNRECDTTFAGDRGFSPIVSECRQTVWISGLRLEQKMGCVKQESCSLLHENGMDHDRATRLSGDVPNEGAEWNRDDPRPKIPTEIPDRNSTEPNSPTEIPGTEIHRPNSPTGTPDASTIRPDIFADRTVRALLLRDRFSTCRDSESHFG